MVRRIIFPVLLFGMALFLGSCEKSNLMDSESPSGSEFYFATDGIDGSGTGGGEGQGNGEQNQPGVITAGEWNDLDNWPFWIDLMQENDWFPMQEYWGFNTHYRFTVEVLDKNNKAVVDAQISLVNYNNEVLWKARTDNHGKAELYGKLFNEDEDPIKIILSYQGTETSLDPITIQPDGVNIFNLDIEVEAPQKINVYFAVDATGSMGDEIEYLKTELEDVISTVQSDHSNLELLLGGAFYRDEGDAYLIENQPFTTDAETLLSFVEDHSAGGGGDFPEAVHTALETSIVEQWEENALCRILFLILDAPPHYESEIVERVQQNVKLAAEKGIKIIPVTASGIDKETEFLMRYMAIATNGTYTFITDDSGIGNDHLEPTVGEYDVEFLNELLIRLISENCEY